MVGEHADGLPMTDSSTENPLRYAAVGVEDLLGCSPRRRRLDRRYAGRSQPMRTPPRQAAEVCDLVWWKGSRGGSLRGSLEEWRAWGSRARTRPRRRRWVRTTMPGASWVAATPSRERSRRMSANSVPASGPFSQGRAHPCVPRSHAPREGLSDRRRRRDRRRMPPRENRWPVSRSSGVSLPVRRASDVLGGLGRLAVAVLRRRAPLLLSSGGSERGSGGRVGVARPWRKACRGGRRSQTERTIR